MTFKTLCFLAFALALPGFVATAPAQTIPAQLSGKLVALRGKTLVPYAAPDLPQAKYIALYFSAGWCGPCHQFTPKLVEFYNEMKPKYPGFEVVFMSRDQGAGAMEKYMAEMSMPWPALRFSVAKSDRALGKYAGSAIPDLVVLNEKGEVLSDSFVGGKYVGPYKVMDDFKNLLAGDSGAVAHADPVAPAASTPSTQTSLKSPSGTNWDETFKKKSP